MDLENAGLLSQSEIDALLASVASAGPEAAPALGDLSGGHAASVTPAFGGPAPAEPGPVVAKDPAPGSSARRYDFRRPDRFSKEQMRALRMIHETWARRIAVSLSAHLRTSVEVTLSDIDQGMYAGLSQQLPDQGIFFTIGLVPLAGHFVIHMSPDLGSIVVDRLMGGPAIPGKAERRMTDLEIELLRDVVRRMLAELQESWASAYNLQPRIDDISQHLMLVPIALPTDAIVWAGFEVRARGYTSGMTLVMPYPALKPIATQLSPYTWVASADNKQQTQSSRDRLEREQKLAKLKLPVSVVLGTTQLGIGELANLQSGDVVPLEMGSGSHGTDGLCTVLINGRPKFLARPGTVRRRMAVMLVGPVQEEPAQPDEDSDPANGKEQGT
jgi:flagellar motor switch protein FliM